MSKPVLYLGIVSFVVGILFIAFPKLIGTWFSRRGLSIWKRHEDDAIGQIRREIQKALPFFSPERVYDEKRAPAAFLILGFVFLIQAVVLFVLSAVM
jgi:hypothetical protein